MAAIHVFWHDGMLKHEPLHGIFDSLSGAGRLLAVLDQHPENATRVLNIKSILEKGPISPRIVWHQGRMATIQELHLFHDPDYIQKLIDADKAGGTTIFAPGTCFNPGSWEAALLAAGSTLDAVKHVLEGKSNLAYALVRPPGHHAQPSRADGYCFLNNAGLAVQFALSSASVKRVAVVDIDVHYGNGTAAGFYSRDDVLTISLHMDHGPWDESHSAEFGQPEEAGTGKGVGYNVNIPLPNGTGDRGYQHAMEKLVVPRLESFEPELIVVTMGQDSSAFDPNGRQCLTMKGYRVLGRMIREQAEKHSSGRMVLVQEGGYQPCYTAFCVHATLEGVAGVDEALLDDPIAYYPEDETYAILKVAELEKRLHQLG
ncbi:hypothetical protein SELMODRAFT_185423 [Selaginella moellendorffii]|uniref:Histone deacetylase domain-containing protein n=1 Tax=Selaginella moellendorffii TaxID=88036 RepID=D8T4T4_SELML|nr:histone deacetylase 8 [Selaginella moellendorffii]XP_024520210.1 histone deacetylase 8 [Selaginella moellendorffii]EFJ08230.1 hypothetical protein SELMODRAFT_185423 [Selaginella moellendorffii]|eukprot:XP_002990598.1 histone deacetylase 8 [Selaginella moellendorffii]